MHEQAQPVRSRVSAKAPSAVPRATYRLQFSKDFTFAQAETLVPHLDALGISHVYASSFLLARAGSSHGYDVIDHTRLNPEIGDEDDLARLVTALKSRGMAMILDFVPNHMGVGGADNLWWLDVLEWGEASPHSSHFDIDWRALPGEGGGKLLLPFLGDQYGAVLERGELVPKFDRAQGSVSVWYWTHRLPVAPADYARILAPVARLLEGVSGAEGFGGIVAAVKSVAGGRKGAKAALARRNQADQIKRRLAAAAFAHDAIDAALADLAGDIGRLHQLLERQAYRLSYWRTAADQINYRRFFDINDLAGLRMEDRGLFDLAHRRVFEMLRLGQIQGVRVDHVDGLFNPAEYCRRLQAGAGVALGRQAEERPMWLVVEKILAAHERVRRDWPVAGTTGYDFCNQVLGLFVDGSNDAAMEQVYAGFVGRQTDFEADVYDAKAQIIKEVMASELNVLAGRLTRLAARHWATRDFTQAAIRRALFEVVACFPVYRTYVTPRRVTDLDRRYIDWAVAKARKQAPEIEGGLFDFIKGVLDTSLARTPKPLYGRKAVLDFAMRFQQYTGPVMAKGFEDTALYRYNRLIALNEVGGDPKRFGMSPVGFHQAMRRRLKDRPQAMLATATHDTKRGEDVRVRLAALSEMPDEWARRLDRWRQLNAMFKQAEMPDANDEILIYQLLLGAWPMTGGPDHSFLERLQGVLVKSLREAKRHTSWSRPDEAYESAALAFLARLVEAGRQTHFLDDFVPFQKRLARLGMVNALAQTLIKLTAPGVPDFFQGSEGWQLALVDPDNRRPIDWAGLAALLDGLKGRKPDQLLRQWFDGGIKMAVIRAILEIRRKDPRLWQDGGYRPLVVRGEGRPHVVAFARTHEGRSLVVAVPRLLSSLWPENDDLPPLGRAWRGLSVEAPPGRFRDVFTDRAIAVHGEGRHARFLCSELFGEWPVAALVSGEAEAWRPPE